MARRFLFPLALVLCMVSVAAGEPGKTVELSSPKLGALAFVRTMEANDMDAFRAVTIGADDDYKLFEPLLGMVGAAKDLEKAARAKFGKSGRLVARNSPAVELEVHIQESDVTVKGDTAVLRHKGQEDSDPLPLKQTSAGWKVDLTAIENRQNMSAAAGGMRKMQQALSESATDIRAGKFKTAQEAEEAVIARMREAAGPAASGAPEKDKK
jgi:hypothetical protein